MEKATFAGGCFWCTEAIFQRLKGVVSVTSGYAGESENKPTYTEVSSGTTAFVEAIQIEFDPKIISYDRLLEIFWATHDPTTLNRQGADVGSQYASLIYYHNKSQKTLAEESKQSQPNANRIVTQIKPYRFFHKAEDYHQNYYETYKFSNPYCQIVIDPKIEKLVNKFNENVKDEYKE